LLAACYGDVTWVMDQDIDTGVRLIAKARERREESRLWQLYCCIYPNFTKETFVTFDKFCRKTTRKASVKSKEQIVMETRKISKLFDKG